jgi:hypothetical protein
MLLLGHVGLVHVMPLLLLLGQQHGHHFRVPKRR